MNQRPKRAPMDLRKLALGPTIACFAMLSVGCARSVEQTPWMAAGDGPEDLTDAFGLELLDLWTANGFPGATAAYILPDGRVGGVAVGLADRENGIAMTPTTRMLSGSVGKTFVAAVALGLAREGKLDLDEKMEKRLGSEPFFDHLPNADEITLRHLLSHSSGLADHVYTEAFAESVRAIVSGPDVDPNAHLTVRDEINLIADSDALFAPGEGYSYTDTGYLIAGLIIEQAAGRTYYEELRRRYLEPLELTLTSPSDRRRLKDLSPGYTDPENPMGLEAKTGEFGVMSFNPASEWTGGGLVSNPMDLVRWARALYGGGAIEGEYLDDLLESGFEREGGHYGLGVGIRQTEHGPSYGHGGWFPGYRTVLSYFPGQGVGICVQVNTDVDADVTAYAMALADLVIGRNAHKSSSE